MVCSVQIDPCHLFLIKTGRIDKLAANDSIITSLFIYLFFAGKVCILHISNVPSPCLDIYHSVSHSVNFSTFSNDWMMTGDQRCTVKMMYISGNNSYVDQLPDSRQDSSR